MNLPIFVFGTLRHDALRLAVAGSALPGRRAHLPDHGVARAMGADGRLQPFPVLADCPGGVAEGVLLSPDANQRARLHAYERLFRYSPEPFWVHCDGEVVEALIYRPEIDSWQSGPEWRIDDWARDWGALRSAAAAEVMALWPDTAPELMAQRYPMIEIAAASRLRAGTGGAPASLRRSPLSGDVTPMATRRPYARYFGVQEDELRFRSFDGGQGPVVTRAGFVMGDAVTVLPYDPARDRVLVVEQFRYGTWLRGDPNPWSLEPIAGRIDPGESPEVAARRETQEEARLTLRDLHAIGSYYPSPAAVTEFLFSFVGLADLDAANEGVAGLATEAEDIRAHVIPFERLMALIATGEVQNGPLMLSAFWLLGHRNHLRKTAAANARFG